MERTTPRALQELYQQEGANISQLLRQQQGLEENTDQIIEIAYDLQTGRYTEDMKSEAMIQQKKQFSQSIVDTIYSLCTPQSVLEAGVGEATTFAGVIQKLKPEVQKFAFDLSWSRIAYAQKWLKKNNCPPATLCTGNLFHIPFADNAIDVVYTSHSIEPNGGSEAAILQELFRVSRKFVILFEPGYELASPEAQERMDAHGYCKNLKNIAQQLGYTVLRHELLPFQHKPLNPTAITIIKKEANGPRALQTLVCPQYKTPLEPGDNMLFSTEGLVAYPIVGGIPCLRIENGIFASKYQEIMQEA